MEIKLDHGGLGTVTITTEHNVPHKVVQPKLSFTGIPGYTADAVKDIFYYEIADASGFYRHRFDINDTTNLDLIAAVSNLKFFDVESIVPEIKAPDREKAFNHAPFTRES